MLTSFPTLFGRLAQDPPSVISCTLTSLPTLRSFRLISSLLALSFIIRALTLESPLLSSSASVSITLTPSRFPCVLSI